MALLAEYALTPDVFDVTSYTSEEVGGIHLQVVKDVLLEEGLVRNLRGGEWVTLFTGGHRPWHRRAKEILKKLATQNRLVPHPAIGKVAPTSDAEWCDEAIATHLALNLEGIIATEIIAANYKTHPIVAAINRLPTTAWWTGRSPSVRLNRTLAGYRDALALVLRHANSMIFIDPHVDPSRAQYRDFASLLQAAGGRNPAPLIEIHRVCYHGSGPNRQILDLPNLEQTFRNQLTGAVAAANIRVDVFIWDDFHDRYLLSDLIGISMPNGFDTTTIHNVTTWTRLGRSTRDDVMREFDLASSRHVLKRRFTIP